MKIMSSFGSSSATRNDNFIIVGAGGLAKEIYAQLKETMKARKAWKFVGFIDVQDAGKRIIDEFQIIGDDDFALSRLQGASVLIGTGSPDARKSIYARYQQRGDFSFPNLIHKSVQGDFANIQLGEGNIIAREVILEPHVQIGNANYLNKRAMIGHDTVINNFCTINAGANISGGVKIGDNCLIGSGAILHQYTSCVSRTIVGIGSVLVQSVETPGTYIGNPARRII